MFQQESVLYVASGSEVRMASCSYLSCVWEEEGLEGCLCAASSAESINNWEDVPVASCVLAKLLLS